MHISYYFFCCCILLCTSCQTTQLVENSVTTAYQDEGRVTSANSTGNKQQIASTDTYLPISNSVRAKKQQRASMQKTNNAMLVQNTLNTPPIFRSALQAPKTNQHLPQDNDSFLLKGMIVDSATLRPIPYATVELIDSVTKMIELYETPRNGSFQFIIEPDKSYTVVITYNGAFITQKNISTANLNELRTIHTFFQIQVDPYDIIAKKRQKQEVLNPTDPLTKPMSDTEGVEGERVNTKDSYGDPYDDAVLTFKIQVGSFKRSMNPNNFFAKLNQKDIDVERAPNGFNRYVTGNFKVYDQADVYQKQLVEKGYTQSFIAAYLNGYRLEMPAEQVIKMYFPDQKKNGTIPTSR